jgi:cytosine/adenosine deaminase-related metal-dependent hydrolase
MDEDRARVTVVRGAHVLTMAPQGDLADGAVAFRDGEILHVGSAVEILRRFPEVEVVGDGRGIVMPGLINAHTHFSEALISGMGETLTLFEWIREIIVPVGRHLSREMARVGTLLRGAEMLLSGVTTVNDMFVHSNLGSLASLGVVDGLQTLGLRGIVSFGAEDTVDHHPVDRFLEEHEALAARAADAPLVGFRLGIGTILSQSEMLFTASIEAARDQSWGVHTHLAEVREEIIESRMRYGCSSVEYARDRGLLDLDVVAGHCIWLGPADIRLLAQRTVKAVHNPVANMILASGVCQVGRLRDAGVIVGLGTDGAASNDSQNMLEALKLAALLQKISHLDPRAMTARECIVMATIDGARCLGLDRLVGSLEPGKRADIVLLTGGHVGLANIHDPYQQVVYCTSPADVGFVWVDGRQLVADGRLAGHDMASLVDMSRPLARELVRRARLTDYSRLA